MLEIKTSYFANHKNFPENSILVSIANSQPKNYFKCLKLINAVPDWKTIVNPYKENKLSESDYKRLYLSYIEKVYPKSEIFMTELNKTVNINTEDLNSKTVILLCYEKPPKMCHRHILREYLNSLMNYKIEELNYKGDCNATI